RHRLEHDVPTLVDHEVLSDRLVVDGMLGHDGEDLARSETDAEDRTPIGVLDQQLVLCPGRRGRWGRRGRACCRDEDRDERERGASNHGYFGFRPFSAKYRCAPGCQGMGEPTSDCLGRSRFAASEWTAWRSALCSNMVLTTSYTSFSSILAFTMRRFQTSTVVAGFSCPG